MSEEKEQAPQQTEKKEEKEPKKVASGKKEEAQPAAQESKPPEKLAHEPHSKVKKLNCMNLEEVEKELKVVKEKMGGFNSRYAQHLLSRKKELSNVK